jgi:hypothetical protein
LREIKPCDALNEAHFDFVELPFFVFFFGFAITLLLSF